MCWFVTAELWSQKEEAAKPPAKERKEKKGKKPKKGEQSRGP